MTQRERRKNADKRLHTETVNEKKKGRERTDWEEVAIYQKQQNVRLPLWVTIWHFETQVIS